MGRTDAEESLGREHEGTEIEAAFAAGNPGLVNLHQFVDRLQERRFRQLRHRQPRGGGLKAARILLGPEQGDAAVVTRIGLQALENFLAIRSTAAAGSSAIGSRARTWASCQPRSWVQRMVTM